MTGFVDLALDRAFVYRENAPSTVVERYDGDAGEKAKARYAMLEKLADFDEVLMEELISDIEPPRDQVLGDLAASCAKVSSCRCCSARPIAAMA